MEKERQLTGVGFTLLLTFVAVVSCCSSGLVTLAYHLVNR